MVDLNSAVGKVNGVLAYAYVEFVSPNSQNVALLLGSHNVTTLWLNGKLIHQYPIYHSGSQMDQFAVQGTLERGRNSILVKVCQNEQKEDWAQAWGFQLRVCDAAGTAVLSSDRKAPATDVTADD